jgi:hypothetical protein
MLNYIFSYEQMKQCCIKYRTKNNADPTVNNAVLPLSFKHNEKFVPRMHPNKM